MEAARQLVTENPFVAANIWTELATRGPVDAEHLPNIMTAALVNESLQRSATAVESFFHEDNSSDAST